MGNKQLQYTYFPISQEINVNETMNFGQWMEYNMRKFFLKNGTLNLVEKISRSFSKNSKFRISLDYILKFYSLFLFYHKLRAIEILYWRRRPLAFTLYKVFFKKIKTGLGLPLCFMFCIIFEENYFLLYSANWPSFITLWDIG